jgi:hypothetical protein
MGHADADTTEVYRHYAPDPTHGADLVERAFGKGSTDARGERRDDFPIGPERRRDQWLQILEAPVARQGEVADSSPDVNGNGTDRLESVQDVNGRPVRGTGEETPANRRKRPKRS